MYIYYNEKQKNIIMVDYSLIETIEIKLIGVFEDNNINNLLDIKYASYKDAKHKVHMFINKYYFDIDSFHELHIN